MMILRPFLRFHIVVVVVVGMVAEMVWGHGYLEEPRSRNWYAFEEGVGIWQQSDSQQPQQPIREYEFDNLLLYADNNESICGGPTLFNDYDAWTDGEGRPLPWRSQATYTEHDVIRVRTVLMVHQYGHMELYACRPPLLQVDDTTTTSPQRHDDCLALEFVRDASHGMPADPAFPERGYYAGNPHWSETAFEMDFRLPPHFFGERVLLQWRYITANSCKPPGYDAYFQQGANAAGVALSPLHWNSQLSDCNSPNPTQPAEYRNCAEVTIVPSNNEDAVTSSEQQPDGQQQHHRRNNEKKVDSSSLLRSVPTSSSAAVVVLA